MFKHAPWFFENSVFVRDSSIQAPTCLRTVHVSFQLLVAFGRTNLRGIFVYICTVTTFKYVGGRPRQSLAEVVWNICFSGCLTWPGPLLSPPIAHPPSTFHLSTLHLHPLHSPPSLSTLNVSTVGGSDMSIYSRNEGQAHFTRENTTISPGLVADWGGGVH